MKEAQIDNFLARINEKIISDHSLNNFCDNSLQIFSSPDSELNLIRKFQTFGAGMIFHTLGEADVELKLPSRSKINLSDDYLLKKQFVEFNDTSST